MLRGSESASLAMASNHTPAAAPQFVPPITTPPVTNTVVTAAPGFSDRPSFDVAALLAPAPPPERDMSGTLLLERYRLLKKLGEGGMGTVYLAEHVTIRKRCAIKLLNPEFAHKQELVDRFLQEAQAASMIAHENVVEITDYGSAPNGSVFFVMEMLIGEDLSETIKRDAPLPWSRVAPIALQICRALAAAHAKGIVHRDMKPENCFRVERHGNSDFIKVLDFGIAKVSSDDPNGTGGRLTSTGMIFGTPTYMSPEQAQGQRVDLRSDIYALGVILFELLTGKVPFSADNFMGILTKHMFDDPPAPSAAAPGVAIDPEVEAIVLKALQKDRAYRFQSMDELAAAILAVGTGAEAVQVVPEARARPISEGRPTSYLSRASTGPMVRAAGEVTLAEPHPEARRVRALLLAMVAGFAVLGGSVAALMAMDGPTEPPVVVAGPALPVPSDSPPRPSEPTPEPQPQPIAATPTPAADPRVYVLSDVAGEVVDPADGKPIGLTGDAGFTLPPGSGPRKVLVRAAGHEDYALELQPIADSRYTATLKPKKAVAVKSGKPRTEPKPAAGKDDKPAAASPMPAPPKPTSSMGLKNPFETRAP